MFKEAKVRLTIIYSLLFLAIFWIFSLGLYFWISQSFGSQYISSVREQEEFEESEYEDVRRVEALLQIAGKVAIIRLRNIILILNGGLLVVIPVIAWVVARKTLSPVQKIHDQQKQFVSDVSHELRTPLSILSGSMEVALRKKRSEDEYIQILDDSKQEIGYLINLVENLLFLTREDQSSIVIRTEKVDITDLLNNVIITLKEKINEKKINIGFIPANESITVKGQTSMLKQLFFNLIDNAINYTPKNGNIRISINANPIDAIIRISDTGIGIAPEEQKKVFERFYRVDTSRSDVKGYGLGLPICASIVRVHKGRLEISSKLDKGTIVSVHLPKL